MTPEHIAAIAKLVAAAKAADNADCHKNSVHAKTGNSLAYWEAVRTSDELSDTFKDLATPEIILTLADALAEAEKRGYDAAKEQAKQAVEDAGWYRSSDDAVSWDAQDEQVQYSIAAIASMVKP